MHRRLMLAAGLGALASPALAQANDPENTLILELKDGRVTIQLLPDLAPRHVERIKALPKDKRDIVEERLVMIEQAALGELWSSYG